MITRPRHADSRWSTIGPGWQPQQHDELSTNEQFLASVSNVIEPSLQPDGFKMKPATIGLNAGMQRRHSVTAGFCM